MNACDNVGIKVFLNLAKIPKAPITPQVDDRKPDTPTSLGVTST